MYCSMFGLRPDDWGREFQMGGITYTLHGINPKRTTYPISAQKLGTDRLYKFTAQTIKMLLGKSDELKNECTKRGFDVEDAELKFESKS